MLDSFRTRLADGEVLILDGGIGTELTARGVAMDVEAWVGPAVVDQYAVVREMHEDYIRAGADVITTNTFATSRQALTAAGLGDRFVEINRRSAQAAREARDRVADRPVLIAGPLFPGFHSANPDTRLPDPPPDRATLTGWLREQADAMAEGGVDVFVLEMIPTAFWAQAALDAIAQTGRPAWLGLSYTPPTAQRRRIAIGDILADLLAAPPSAEMMALTVMHTEVEHVDGALDEVQPMWDGLLGVYPHHGRWHPTRDVPEFEPLPIASSELVEAANGWVRRGAQIIGGCCGITPEHIRALKEELPRRVPDSSQHEHRHDARRGAGRTEIRVRHGDR